VPVDPGQARDDAHTATHRCDALLLAGNDITVIALWLGHEQIATTNIYLHADMTQKQKAIDRVRPAAANKADTDPPTPSSPSWRTCDYADLNNPTTSHRNGPHAEIGITPTSA